MFDFLNRNAAAIQAVGSVAAILVAIGIARWSTYVSRRDQAAARHRAARVLAMELQPVVTAVHDDLERALEKGWNAHQNIDSWREKHIAAPDAVERTLSRLDVLDDETIGPILRMLSAMRDYQRVHSQVREQFMAALAAGEPVELEQQRTRLENACRNAADAVERLDEAAKV